eukprot:PhM_4_TR11859/c0_g1_i1/m.65912
MLNNTTKKFALEEVQKHTNPDESIWVIITGKVYDVTAFASHHPGGARVLHRVAGTDCTDAFTRLHGRHTWDRLPEFEIGSLVWGNGTSQAAKNFLTLSGGAASRLPPPPYQQQPRMRPPAPTPTFAADLISSDPILGTEKSALFTYRRLVLRVDESQQISASGGISPLPMFGHVSIFGNNGIVTRSYSPISVVRRRSSGSVVVDLTFVIKSYPDGEVSPFFVLPCTYG